MKQKKDFLQWIFTWKRRDLIPNIVQVVKRYAKHEKDTLKENEQMSGGLIRLMALAEAYPDLKANDNFLSLQKDLSSIEDEIAQSRKYYNAVVRNFNNKVEMIPSNIVAKMLGYKPKTMFEANASERENVKEKF